MNTTNPQHTHYDAIIVGARCAGSATAMLLARKGLSVLALERSPYGSDTLSTHALMRGGVLQLSRWGVLDDVVAAETPKITRTTFHYGDEEIALPIKPRDGVDGLYAPRRTILDRVLVDAASDAGAEIVFGLTVADLIRDEDGRVCGVVARGSDGENTHITTDIVIGADGVRSTVARLTGAEIYHRGGHATGCVYGHWRDLEVDGYQWYFRPGVSAGAIPTNDGGTCVFISVPDHRFRTEIRSDVTAGFHRALSECAPEIASSLSHRPQVGRTLAFGGVNGYLRKSWGPGWALVGDAGYFKDPLTAHGISDALRDAELLARAVAHGSDAAYVDYQTGRDYLSLCLFETTDRIASFDWTINELKRLHLDLSEQMHREEEAILDFGDAGFALARTA